MQFFAKDVQIPLATQRDDYELPFVLALSALKVASSRGDGLFLLPPRMTLNISHTLHKMPDVTKIQKVLLINLTYCCT